VKLVLNFLPCFLISSLHRLRPKKKTPPALQCTSFWRRILYFCSTELMRLNCFEVLSTCTWLQYCTSVASVAPASQISKSAMFFSSFITRCMKLKCNWFGVDANGVMFTPHVTTIRQLTLVLKYDVGWKEKHGLRPHLLLNVIVEQSKNCQSGLKLRLSCNI